MMLLTYINESSYSSSSPSSSPQNSPRTSKPFGSTKRSYSTSSSLPKSNPNCSSIVLWGSNLSSTLGLRFSDRLRNIVSLPSYIKSVVVGLLLGDGYLQKGKSRKNARLGLTTSLKSASYALWMFSVLAHYCQSSPYVFSASLKGVVHYCLKFQTRAYPCLTLLHSVWYLDGIKVLPPTIFDDLTPVALAVWAQGDGSKHTNGFTFSTHSFTLQQVVLLLRYSKHKIWTKLYNLVLIEARLSYT